MGAARGDPAQPFVEPLADGRHRSRLGDEAADGEDPLEAHIERDHQIARMPALHGEHQPGITHQMRIEGSALVKREIDAEL